MVVSYGGLKAAQILKERFGQPYVIGVPIGPLQDAVYQALLQAVRTGENQYPCWQRSGAGNANIAVIGESVYASSLAAAVEMAAGMPVQVLCPLEPAEKTLQETDCRIASEQELQARLREKDIVIADPLYQPVCPASGRFIPLGHEAFSGRMYQHEIPDLMKTDVFSDFVKQIKGV